jgi:hypothetical protein
MFVRIVLLLLVGALSGFAASEQHIEENFAVTAGAKLIVDVDFGTIDIGHGEDNRIAVSAYRKIEGPSEAQEEEYLSMAPLRITKEGNTVIVRARPEHDGVSWNWCGQVTTQVRYTIRTPSELNAELQTGGGGITAAELSGFCKAETGGGNALTLRTGAGNIVIKSTNLVR